MSHIGNKIRAGFFATPLTQGEFMKKLVVFNQDTTLLDTTCGEGEILHYLASEQEVTVATYGVEIDKGRAELAAQRLDIVLAAPIESCVISNNHFGMTYCNPPYDFTMKGEGDASAERKEYIELVRATKYLRGGGVMMYVIPSYRFADPKIARFLATNFEKAGIARFGDEDYFDFSQTVFIGYKKATKNKIFSQKMFDFLSQLDDDRFVMKLATLEQLVEKGKTWQVPQSNLEAKLFYTKLENKEKFIDLIRANKGFEMFKERAKPRDISLNGQPIINISQGEMALLLASGMINGIVGEGDDLHALQGLEIVETIHEKEEHEDGVEHISRTKRSVSVKVITPKGIIKKLV